MTFTTSVFSSWVETKTSPFCVTPPTLSWYSIVMETDRNRRLVSSQIVPTWRAVFGTSAVKPPPDGAIFIYSVKYSSELCKVSAPPRFNDYLGLEWSLWSRSGSLQIRQHNGGSSQQTKQQSGSSGWWWVGKEKKTDFWVLTSQQSH